MTTLLLLKGDTNRWNTFETRGACPACGRAWRETQCRCLAWSPHDEWYAEE